MEKATPAEYKQKAIQRCLLSATPTQKGAAPGIWGVTCAEKKVLPENFICAPIMFIFVHIA
jgi:hypothetical protein